MIHPVIVSESPNAASLEQPIGGLNAPDAFQEIPQETEHFDAPRHSTDYPSSSN